MGQKDAYIASKTDELLVASEEHGMFETFNAPAFYGSQYFIFFFFFIYANSHVFRFSFLNNNSNKLVLY